MTGVARQGDGTTGSPVAWDPSKRTSEQIELDRARRRIERLENDLAKHQLALETQGKASELLGRLLAESDETNSQQP